MPIKQFKENGDSLTETKNKDVKILRAAQWRNQVHFTGGLGGQQFNDIISNEKS